MAIFGKNISFMPNRDYREVTHEKVIVSMVEPQYGCGGGGTPETLRFLFLI